MTTRFRTLLILGSGVMLTACAGMSEQACLATDWTTVGFEDGAAGRPESSIGRYRQMCGEHGISPDLASYRAGHSDGVTTYCRPGNGFEVGRRGAVYQNVCPAGLEGDFVSAYTSGRQLFELESALRQVDNRIAQNGREQESIKQELTSIAAAMVSAETSAEDRVRMVARAAELGERHGELGNETELLLQDRVVHEQALLAYRETLAFAF
jgi:hypothetical protein